MRLIPAPVLAELRREAARRLAQRPRIGWSGAVAVAAIWVALAVLAARALGWGGWPGG